MDSFLSRVDLIVLIEDLIHEVAVSYNLGNVIKWKLIKEGYQELNIKTVTQKGVYVIKIFSDKFQKKTVTNIQDNIKSLIELSKAGIPVPKLLKAKNNYIYKTKGRNGDTYLCIMEFFEGKSFQEIKPTLDDMKKITHFLTKIHSLKFKISRYYDSWGTANVVKEFKNKRKELQKEDIEIIEPIIEDFKKIDFSKFKKCNIHGDLQRKHILKSKEGNYCILDLGVMSFDAAAIDLGIFIALFCFDLNKSIEENKKIYEIVLSEYLKNIKLNSYELKFLPLFIKATYAIYVIGSNHEIVANKDRNKQTIEWLSFGRNSLRKFKEI